MTKSSPSEVKRVVVGKVGAPHGVRGEVKVIPLTDFPDRFDNLTEITVGEELLAVEKVRWQGKDLIVKFAPCQNRDEAARLTGKFLTVNREEAAPLQEGEYYTFDLVGLKVLAAGEEIGIVANVLKTGSNDVFAVKKKDGGEIFIPALKKTVKEINISAGFMTVELMEEI